MAGVGGGEGRSSALETGCVIVAMWHDELVMLGGGMSLPMVVDMLVM